MSLKRYEAWKASKIEESRGSRKPSRVNESWKPLTDKAEIEAWLEEMEIKNYTIDDDGTVDVQGSVALNNIGLKEIPVQFGLVTGYFNCSKNQLKSLKGAPEEVGHNFGCSENQLTSLEGAPKEVYGDFICSDNRLTSLEGAPEKVGGFFFCSNNRLTSLEGISKKIGESIYLTNNKLTREYLFSAVCPKIDCDIFDVTGNFKDDKPKNIKCSKFKY